MKRLRLIGLGHPEAEVDQSGLRLFEALQAKFPKAETERWVTPKVEAAEDLALYAVRDVVVIVDSLGPGQGRDEPLMTRYRPGLLDDEEPVSTHGFGLGPLLELATALSGAPPMVYLVGVPSEITDLPKSWVHEAEQFILELLYA